MDVDMQHPVSVIPEMLRHWEEGYDDVYAQRQVSKESWLKRKTSQWYYKLLQSLTHVPIQKDTGDFRLLDRSCVDALKQMRETERNTKGMYSWIGFRKKGIFYQQQERQTGKSKWSAQSLFHLALNGIMSYTTAPLKLASVLGLMVSFHTTASVRSREVYLSLNFLKTNLTRKKLTGTTMANTASGATSLLNPSHRNRLSRIMWRK